MDSTLRFLVDEALEARLTTFEEFIETGRNNGNNLKVITEDLAFVTGIPVSWRTIYRWTRIP